VEAVRVGYIVARDKRAWSRWKTRSRHPQAVAAADGAGLTGAALDQAIAAIALRRPDLVFAVA
jgi:hypothetical protein